MDERNRLGRPKELSKQEFDLLLYHLHPDRDEAADEYLLLLEKLRCYFDAPGCAEPDALAAETLRRTAKKLAGGEKIASIVPYCYGVARLIRLESYRNTDARTQPLAELTADPIFQIDSLEQQELAAKLDRCLRSLPPQDAQLFVEYWVQENEQSTIESRRLLAQRMGLSATALRLRIFRIRARLYECFQKNSPK